MLKLVRGHVCTTHYIISEDIKNKLFSDSEFKIVVDICLSHKTTELCQIRHQLAEHL